MAKFELTGQPCPCGKSSDAYSIDHEGNGFCFRGDCNKFFKNNSGESMEENHKPEDVSFEYYPHRGLSRATCEIYDLKTKLVRGEPYETGFYYPWLKAYKFRRHGENVPKNQRFYTTEGMVNPGLYGKDKFDPGSKESIVICEGLYDSLSVFEMMNARVAAVSVSASGQALRDVTQDREYVNSFSKIYICMDNDASGEEATRQIATAGIFDYNKLYIVRYHKYKDPNEYLTNGDSFEFVNTFKSAKRYSPDNIISTFSEIEKSLEESGEQHLASYPFERLDNALYGMHEEEIIVWKGFEGIGKTELFRAIEYHVLKTTEHKIGIIHLEESNGTTVKAIAGYELEVPAVLPDCGLSKQDILNGYKRAVKDDEGRVHIYSSYETEDENAFIDHVRFLAAVAGCKIIFLDHITWLGTGLESDDERRKLDRISQKLKLLAKELKIAIHEISHINDDGKTRGSRNISKVANTVIMINRDLLTTNQEERNTIYLVVEKARLGGRTGPCGRVYLNPETRKLEDLEVKEKEIAIVENLR